MVRDAVLLHAPGASVTFAAMSISKQQLVDALRARYDAYSAESMFQMACARAGLEDAATFDAGALIAFRGGLEQVGDRLATVLAQLDAVLEGAQQAAVPSVTQSPMASVPVAPSTTRVDDTRSDASVDKPAVEVTGEATIVLSGVDVADGEQLLVCGASPELGDWEPARARPMVRHADQWRASVKLANDDEVAFKFLRRTDDGDVTWEPGGNRVVRGTERVDAMWRSES